MTKPAFGLFLLSLITLAAWGNSARAFVDNRMPTLTACMKFKPDSPDLTDDSLATLAQTMKFVAENRPSFGLMGFRVKYRFSKPDNALAEGDYHRAITLANRRQEMLAEAMFSDGKLSKTSLNGLKPVFSAGPFTEMPECDASLMAPLGSASQLVGRIDSELCTSVTWCILQCTPTGCGNRPPEKH